MRNENPPSFYNRRSNDCKRFTVMMGSTHSSAGVALAVALAINAHQPMLAILGLAVVGGIAALAPDIDHPKSTLGRRVMLGALIFHHRGFLHSPLALALLGLACWHFLSALLGLVIVVGYGSHLLLDALNPQGIPLLYPSGRRFRFANWRTGGMVDQVLGGLAVCGIVGLLIFASSVSFPELFTFIRQMMDCKSAGHGVCL